MFILRSKVRARVLSYRPRESTEIQFCYTYNGNQTDIDSIVYASESARDLMLAEIDAGNINLVVDP